MLQNVPDSGNGLLGTGNTADSDDNCGFSVTERDSMCPTAQRDGDCDASMGSHDPYFKLYTFNT